MVETGRRDSGRERHGERGSTMDDTEQLQGTRAVLSDKFATWVLGEYFSE